MVVEGARTGTGSGREGGGAGAAVTAVAFDGRRSALRRKRTGRLRNRLAGNFGRLATRQFRNRLAIRSDNLHQEQETNRVLLKASHHGFKHVEGLFLVGHQRILLAVSAQTDAFLEVVHAQQMVFPQAVEHAEHDHALMQPHGVDCPGWLPSSRTSLSNAQRSLHPVRAGSACRADAFLLEINAELRSQLSLEAVHVPLIGMHRLRSMLRP